MRPTFLVLVAACSTSDVTPGLPDSPARTIDAPPRADAAPTGPSIDAGSIPADDTFDGTSLDGAWAVHNVDKVDIAVAKGQLRLAPHANAAWVNGKDGALVFKLVNGDFKVTTTVHARLTADLTQPIDHGFQIGGLMARDQDFPPANYVFIDAGLGTQDALAVLHMSTKNGTSTSGESPWGADAELRICRTGSTFTLYKRNPGDTTWMQDDQVVRDDLPPTLQVGPSVSTGIADVNSTFLFDAVDFAPVGGGCTQ